MQEKKKKKKRKLQIKLNIPSRKSLSLAGQLLYINNITSFLDRRTAGTNETCTVKSERNYKVCLYEILLKKWQQQISIITQYWRH